MSELAIMAIISVISSVITASVNAHQQRKEFEQQQQLQEDAQEFQAQREDLLFERNSIPSQFQQMLDSGFNPILAASSLMGGNNVQAASSDSSPGAPTTNSAIGALSSMLTQNGTNLYDAWKNQAEIQNIQADTDKKEVETGIMPRDYNLRMLSTLGQLKVWDASVERTKAAQHLDEEQTKYVQNQNLYYGRMAEAQIHSYEGQLAEAYAAAVNQLEQAKTESHKRANLDANTELAKANVEVAHDTSTLISNQSSSEYYRSESLRIAQEFEKKLGGIPLTADGQKYVQKLVAEGDIDGINKFYQSIFATALNQQAGSEFGSMPKAGFPFGILGGIPLYGYNKGYQPSMPFWNPYNN